MAEIQQAFTRELIHSAWTAPVSRGQAVAHYLQEVYGTGWEMHYARWREERKPSFLRRRLFRSAGLTRPICQGGDVVRRWVVDGPPVRAPRVGVGFGVRPRMVWVPREESPDPPREVVRTPWDNQRYLSILLGR